MESCDRNMQVRKILIYIYRKKSKERRQRNNKKMKKMKQRDEKIFK